MTLFNHIHIVRIASKSAVEVCRLRILSLPLTLILSLLSCVAVAIVRQVSSIRLLLRLEVHCLGLIVHLD